MDIQRPGLIDDEIRGYLMQTKFTGRIDDDINFCPHCGKRLELVSVEHSTECPECGKAFLVLKDAKRVHITVVQPRRRERRFA